jgi:hypothetical protein
MSFDPETINLMKNCLEDVWVSLSPAMRSSTTRSALAERILKKAAGGERDPVRLRASALHAAAPSP